MLFRQIWDACRDLSGWKSYIFNQVVERGALKEAFTIQKSNLLQMHIYLGCIALFILQGCKEKLWPRLYFVNQIDIDTSYRQRFKSIFAYR